MARVMRVSIVGQLPSGEEWSVNPIYAIGGDFGITVSALQAQQIATAIAAIAVPTGLLLNMNTATNVSGCRVEARSITGALEALGEANKTTPTAGTGLTSHPFQTAQVISLRTALAGGSGRGRLYWPATGRPLTPATLRVPTADVVSFLSGAKTYLSGIETAIEATLTGVSLVVWSRTLAAVNNVTQLQSGDVLDVQRRRRDALIEGLSATPWP